MQLGKRGIKVTTLTNDDSSKKRERDGEKKRTNFKEGMIMIKDVETCFTQVLVQTASERERERERCLGQPDTENCNTRLFASLSFSLFLY